MSKQQREKLLLDSTDDKNEEVNQDEEEEKEEDEPSIGKENKKKQISLRQRLKAPKPSKQKQIHLDIQTMRVTPKIEFKSIPSALMLKEAPLDHELWSNTQMEEDDPRLIPQLSSQIYRYLRRVECLHEAGANYLSRQSEIDAGKRSISIDWLLRLSHEMRLKRDTFYLATSMIDRYLELKVIPLNQLDKLTLSCLFCAAKYEEMVFPTIKDFVYLSDNTLTEDDIFGWEVHILETLGWRMTHCHPMTFIDELAKGMNLAPRMYHFAQFLVEIMIYKGYNCQYKNSLIGSSVLYICLQAFPKSDRRKEPVSPLFSLYTQQQVSQGASKILSMIRSTLTKKEEQSSAVIKKFKKGFYSKVAEIDVNTLNIKISEEDRNGGIRKMR